MTLLSTACGRRVEKSVDSVWSQGVSARRKALVEWEKAVGWGAAAD